jgi:hypothetical protein
VRAGVDHGHAFHHFARSRQGATLQAPCNKNVTKVHFCHAINKTDALRRSGVTEHGAAFTGNAVLAQLLLQAR